MKSGNTIYAKSHCEFLNELLDRDYERYMKCTCNLGNGYMIWFVRFDGKQSKQGWTNSILNNGNTIAELYTGEPCDRLAQHYNLSQDTLRLVFDVKDGYDNRAYEFCGVFEFDRNSDNTNRIWKKISDTYNF